MTKISRRRKIASWECVKDLIQEITENVPENTTALSLPYGMQSLYDISHPEPVKILLHPNMNDYDTFVTHHGKAKKFYLNLWTVNQTNSCTVQEDIKQQKMELNYQLKHILYVPTHRCFVAFATDLTLRVFATVNFIEMSRAETSHSVLCLYYNACRDDVLAGCLGFVMIWKFPHAQSDPMFATQKIECAAIDPEYWVTWIKVDKNSKQLLLNCEEAIVILDEGSYELKHNFKIDFRHSLPFTACALYHPSCYFITGSKDYAIKVWNTSLNQCPLVTSFFGHCKAITALEVDIPHHLVISSSTDKTIRLWCLETFALTYCLETGEEVHHMELMTSQRLFYQSHEHIRVWNLNHFHTLFTVLGFEIVTSRRVVSHGFPTRLLLHGEDGAIRIVSPSDGTIITTMFPLETLPESIVDYAYNPREDRLYVVLSSGAILVFNTRTNPCSTHELWRYDIFDGDRVTSTSFAESHGVSCVAMMNIEELSEMADDQIQYYTLLFAGLNNGHLSLVYSNELSMHDTIEAHYGKIALLRVSEGLGRENHNSLHAALLVSCGTDCELKIWKIVFRNYSARIISLELWSMVKLVSIPHDMELIGYIIGLVMDNNSLMTCRVKSEPERPARNLQTHRDSVSRQDQYDIECFTSALEETHSKTITGLSACPTLGLFATSSNDWSVKIWSTEAKLVKEICFEESLRGVCFANPRGDLLVGFQSHISIVPLTNYLPLKILEMLSTMEFPDDVFEDHLPFDRMLSFSYDPLRTPCLPLDLDQRRLMLQQQEECCIKPALRLPSVLLLLDNQPEDADSDDEETVPAPRRYSTTQEQDEVDEKIRKFQRSSLSRRSSALQSPILEEVIARITQSSRSHITTTNVEASSVDLVEQLRRLFDGDDTKIPDDYWPCAPDGFIPNSVVRQRVPPKEIPAHLIPRLMRGDELEEWIKMTKKKSSKESVVSMPEDCYYPIAFDDDELGFCSIFDGYDETSHGEKQRSLLDSDGEDEEEEEEKESSDEEVDLKKKWKASTKTTINKAMMLSSLRARQAVRDRKKVSKKPEMPMIMAAEEEDESDDVREETQEQHSTENVEEEDPALPQLPDALRQMINETWFPQTSLVGGVTVEKIFQEMIHMLTNCAPITYGKICDAMVGLISSVGISDDQKSKMLQMFVENLNHPSIAIRRTSIKSIQKLGFVSDEAVKGIVSCLAQGNNDLQKDAMNALDQLLGIRDKEGLRELFISMDILSRSPSPERETPLKHLKRLATQERKDVLGTRGSNRRSDKDKYIHEWLTVGSKSAIVGKTESFQKESRRFKMASSIVSKIKTYKKPDARLSIVDLTFNDDSSRSSQASSEVEEETAFQSMELNEDVIRKLKRTKAGCALLSRLGHDKTPVDSSEDPIMTLGVRVEKIEKHAKNAKRPPSALMGFAYGKTSKISEQTFSPGEQGNEELGPETDNDKFVTEDKEEGRCPEIRLSEVSSLSRGTTELQEDINKLVLPKIFQKIKQNQQNIESRKLYQHNCDVRKSYQQNFDKRKSDEQGSFDRTHKRESDEQNSDSGKSGQGNYDRRESDEQNFNGKKFGHENFEAVRRNVRGDSRVTRKDYLKLPGLDGTSQEWRTRMPARADLPDLPETERSSRGKRLTSTDSSSAIDKQRRKSILRELRTRRLEQQTLAEQLLANQDRSLVMKSSLEVPSPSKESVPSTEVHSPKIDIRSEQVGSTKISSLKGVISDDTTRGIISDDVVRGAISDDVTQGIMLDDITRGVIPDDIARGALSDYIIRGVISDGIARGALSDDRAPGVISNDIARSVISDDIARGVMSKDRATGVISGDRARCVISDDRITGVISDDTTRVVPGTNVPYLLCTDVVGERLSHGTSVMARRPVRDLGINNEALRVLPVNPKLTIDTGCNKWGRSRYGILEVMWTARGIYDTRDFAGSTLRDVNHKLNEQKNLDEKPARVPATPLAVKNYLKPIRNRNLVTNPYTLDTMQYLRKTKFPQLPRLPSISERAPSVTPSDSESSSQSETELLCTVQELLDVTKFCYSRSS